MVTSKTVVVGVNPDLTYREFAAILQAAPGAATTTACYNAIVRHGVSVAFALGVFLQESSFGNNGRAVGNKSPGNTRSSANGKGKENDGFVQYTYWEDGWDDLAFRLVKPGYVYAQEGRRTIEQIITKFSPPDDGNDTARYIKNVVTWMNGWLTGKEVSMEVIDLTADTPSDVYTSRYGYKIDTLVLHDTAGSNANPDKNSLNLNFVSRETGTINWFQGGGGLSIHYLIGPEKAGGKIYRLCREAYAAFHAVGNRGSAHGTSVANLTSIGIERWGYPNEQVGPNQRAAMLWLVADIARRNNLKPEQIISHKSIQSDRTDGEVLLAEARAAVAKGTTPVADNTDVIVIKETGMKIGGGFRKFWEALDKQGENYKLANLGWPTSNEFDMALDGKPRTVQLFERGMLIYEEENKGVWNVHYATLQQVLLARTNVGLSNVG